MASPRGCVAADRHPGPLHSEQTPPPSSPRLRSEIQTQPGEETRAKRVSVGAARGRRGANATESTRSEANEMQSGGFGDHAPPPGTGACSRTTSLGAGRGPRGALASTEAGTLSRKAVCRRAREDRQRPRLSAEIAVDGPMSRKWPCVCRRGLSHKVHVLSNTDNIVFFRWKRVTWVHGEISQTLPQDQAGLVTRQPGPLLRHPRPAVLGISVGPCAPRVGSTPLWGAPPCGEHPLWGAVTCLPSLLCPMSPSDS